MTWGKRAATGDKHIDFHESHNMFASSGCRGNFTGTVHAYKKIVSKFGQDGNGKLSWTGINVTYYFFVDMVNGNLKCFKEFKV